MATLEHLSERDLLLKLPSCNSQEAFAELIRRYSGMVLAVCHRVLGEDGAAEDAAQAAYLVFIRRGRFIKPDTVLASWLFRVSVLCARNAKRSRVRRLRHEREAGLRTAARSNQGSLWEAVRPQLDEALASLPTRQQEVLILHFLQGMSREEVARTLHCGQETVNTHVTRGLQKLRQRLRRSGLYLPLPTLEAQLRKWLKPHPPQGWAASGTGGGLKDPVSPFSARVAMEVERECLGFQLAGLGLALPLGLSLALVVAISAVYFASAKPIAPVGANPVTILPPGSLAAATPPVPDHDGLHLDDPRLWILDEPGGAMGKPIQRYKTWVEVPFDPPLGFRFWKMGLFHHRYWPLTAAPVSLRAGITYTPRASRSGSFQLMALLDPRRPLQDGLQPSLHLLCMQNGQWFVSQSANLKRSVFEQQRFDPGPHVLELRISDREWATFVDGRCLYRDAHGFSDLQVRLGMGFVTEPDPTVTLRVDQVTVGPSGWNGEAPSEDGF